MKKLKWKVFVKVLKLRCKTIRIILVGKNNITKNVQQYKWAQPFIIGNMRVFRINQSN